MLGPSGTGKSVLLKTLIGLLKPDYGSVVHRGHRHRQLLGEGPLRDPQAVRRAVPGRRDVRLDEPLRQRRLPAARAHQEDRVRDPRHRHGEDGARRPGRRRGQAPRRDLRRHAQARRPGPRAGPRPRDRPLRRAGLRPRPGPHGLPQPADRRPQRPDRRHVPDRHPRHQHRPHGAGQHRPALPQAPGDVRAPRDAAVLRGAGRPAVPQRPDGRARSACREEKDADELEAENDQELPPLPPIPLQIEPVQRHAAPQPARARRSGAGRTASTPPPGLVRGERRMAPGA